MIKGSAGEWARRRRWSSGPIDSRNTAPRPSWRTATFGSPTPRASGTRSRSSRPTDAPLIADHPEVPKEMALQGFDGALAYSTNPDAQPPAVRGGPRLRARGRRLGGAGRAAAAASGALPSRPRSQASRGGHRPPHRLGARRSTSTRHWRERVMEAGAQPDTGDRPLLLPLHLLPRAERGAVRDRHPGPGFTADEPLDTLGEKLSLPPDYEPLRERIEATVKPITNPRVAARKG